ncbi:unnamed protein product [Somion occarium]|uniref:Uncharacterized protein n=1 Tax=Somion occarium TaxID=3059160 RepID=A0ABP1DUA4_9APHY
MAESSRYIPFTPADPNDFDIRATRNATVDALDSSVRRVHRHPSSRAGVYIGSAGTILMDWVVSSLPDISMKPPSSLAFSMSISPTHSGAQTSFLETSVGPATLMLIQQLRNVHSGRGEIKSETWEPCIGLVTDALYFAINEELDALGDGCEVLYGRAGLLYALLRLRDEVGKLALSKEQLAQPVVEAILAVSADASIRSLVDDIVARGIEGAGSYAEELHSDERRLAPPLMWSWHGKRYLGGAHGVAGILQMLISAPKHLLVDHWDMIVRTISWLVDIQLPSGNWPSKAGRHMFKKVEEDERDQLIQWCHGATGTLILLSTLLRKFSSQSTSATTSSSTHRSLGVPETLVSSARKALASGGDLVYTHGLLRKGVGLCHGVAGSVFALLAVSDALSSPISPGPTPSTQGQHAVVIDQYFFYAIHLSQLALSYETLTQRGDMRVPDRPYSLYEGLAGMCCAWAEVVKRLDRVLQGQAHRNTIMGSGMPGYDDLGDLE